MAHQVSLSSLSLSPPPSTSAAAASSSSSSSHCSQRRRIFLSTLRFEAASSLSASTPNSKAKVVVTRERGKNGKLIKALVCYSSLSLSLSPPLLSSRDFFFWRSGWISRVSERIILVLL